MPKSDVYYIKCEENPSVSNQIAYIKKLIDAAPFDSILEKKQKVGVKIHVGEKHNDTHVPPEVIKAVCARIKRNGASPFLTETSTLYKGERSNALDHLNLAYSHGFTPKNVGAPFIMADGLAGDTEMEVKIPGKLYDKVSIAKEALMADGLVIVTHVTGHLGTGMGAAFKNVGMGLASRKGKLRQHSSMKPVISPRSCTFCKKCIKWCPEEAIVEKDSKAFILQDKCVGCGECLAVCGYNAVHYNWGTESGDLQKKIVEHCLGVLEAQRDKIFFINVLINMTADCDCMAVKQDKVIPDVGILASNDILAIDQASLELTTRVCPSNIGKVSHPNLNPEIQLAYAEELGIGSREYNLIEVENR